MLKCHCDVARKSEVVILMLPDTPEVNHVLMWPNGVIAGLRPGTLVIDMSTISPIEIKRLADAVRGAGGSYLDAPANTATTQELMNSCTVRGFKDTGHSALARALEAMSDHALSTA